MGFFFPLLKLDFSWMSINCFHVFFTRSDREGSLIIEEQSKDSREFSNDDSVSNYFVDLKDYRLFIVPYFSMRSFFERFGLWAAILHECQNYLGGGGGLGRREKNITSLQLAFRKRDGNFTPFTIY